MMERRAGGGHLGSVEPETAGGGTSHGKGNVGHVRGSLYFLGACLF